MHFCKEISTEYLSTYLCYSLCCSTLSVYGYLASINNVDCNCVFLLVVLNKINCNLLENASYNTCKTSFQLQSHNLFLCICVLQLYNIVKFIVEIPKNAKYCWCEDLDAIADRHNFFVKSYMRGWKWCIVWWMISSTNMHETLLKKTTKQIQHFCLCFGMTRRQIPLGNSDIGSVATKK